MARLISLGVILSLVASIAWAETTDGAASARIVGGDLLAARGAAHRDACRVILAKTLAKAGATNSEELATQLSGEPGAYLSKLTVVEEGLKGDAEYRMALSAEPDLEQLRAAIGESNRNGPVTAILPNEQTDRIQPGDRPTVAVVITEKYGTTPDAPATLAPALEEWLTREGFVCVSLEQAQIATVRDQAAAVLKGDTAAAKAVAATLGAAWLLIGNVQIASSAGLQGSDMKPHSASISVRLVQADSSAVITNATVTGSCPGINELNAGREAIKRGVAKLLPDLARGINKLMAGSHPLSGRIVVRVFGVIHQAGNPHEEFGEIVRNLGSVPGVVAESVRILSQSNGLLEVDLRTTNQSTQAFASAVAQRSFSGNRLILLDQLPRLLSFQLGAVSAALPDGARAARKDALLGEVQSLKYRPVDEARIRANNAELAAAMKQRVANMAANDAKRRELAALERSLEDATAQAFAAEKQRAEAAERLTAAQQQLEALRGQLATMTRELGEQQAANGELAASVRSKEQSLAQLTRDADQAQDEVGRRQSQLAGIRQRIRSYEA